MKTGWCEIHETTTIEGVCTLCEIEAEAWEASVPFEQRPGMEDMGDE